MAGYERLGQLLSAVDGPNGADVSRATSPGAGWEDSNGDANAKERPNRVRPRTFPYTKYLPYESESDAERLENLDACIKHLYVAVAAGDFSPGAVHWTREIRGWLSLKFDLPRDMRVKLIKLYYELALAPGLDILVAERFASMFMVLTKRKHYLRPGKDLILDWRPLYKELKNYVLPSESGSSTMTNFRRNIRTVTKLCTFAQLYFDPQEIPAMLEEFLPFFSTSFSEGAYVVVGLLNLILPTTPAPADRPDLHPQHYLPTFFHLWSLVNRSRLFDVHFIDICSRLARDSLSSKSIPFTEHGLFTKDQSQLIFTAILRLLEIPVGQSTSPYSSSVDAGAGLAIMLDRDQRKHPIAHHVARWIVMSLSPACLDKPDSILARLEGLIQAVETFYHPSNSGSWTKTLSQLVYYLADFFVMRWNREHSGEMEVPEDRRLNDAVKKRFVLCLRDVIFMGIFAKSGTAINFSLSTLQCLAFLEPNLILPGALQRIYPAMQGLVEVHRTISSIRALHMLSKTMVRTKGYRCHITTLLGLALPGIDANDLEKTLHTLSYIQSVSYIIPFHDLTKEKRTVAKENGDISMENGGIEKQGSGVTTPMPEQESTPDLALQWIASQVDRLEREGAGVEFDYEEELSDQEEEAILRSSTTGFAEFVITFLGRVFTLLENLPDASRVRSGSPEENVVNTLPAAFTPLLSSLSPELFDIALDKIANFVTNHVIHQARDAMAFICNGLVKVNPQKTLKRLLPDLLDGIRTEIGENGAGSSRTTGSEVLPKDRALVWNISLLSMCVVHVGDAVLDYKDELFDIAKYMQEHCRGIPTVHVSNFIHHLLLNLTCIYTVDYSIFEPSETERGLTVKDWGKMPDAKDISVKWHVPSPKCITFAVELFASQVNSAMDGLKALTGDNSPVKRDGTGKEWSDEVSRNLVLLRLIISGVSVLFDSKFPAPSPPKNKEDSDADMEDSSEDGIDNDLGDAEDDESRPTFQYEVGYPWTQDDSHEQYRLIHGLRQEVGQTLHRIHQFLVDKQEDDVPCFNALYNAYRSWFIDVGIERSAHVLDRVTRLLAADVHPFKVSGLRKEYPRPLLVRRAYVYHLQRLRHNAAPRERSDLEEQLLMDLAHSSVSLYTEIRRTAQTANESAVKCIVGSRPLVIPPLLKAFDEAVKKSDYPRIKGAMFSLLFGSLAKTISRNWKFTPQLIKSFIEVTEADKPSVQKLVSNATFQIMDMGKPLERMVILDEDVVEAIVEHIEKKQIEEFRPKISKKRDAVKRKRAKVESKKSELSAELVEQARASHWKKAIRTATVVINLGMRFENIASEAMIDLATKGTIDPHPTLRSLYQGALLGFFQLVQTRSLAHHSYEKYILSQEDVPEKIAVPTRADEDPSWTDEYLESFGQPEAKYYVDFDYPGWLVWNKTMPAFLTETKGLEYDNVETKVRKQIGGIIDRNWFSTYFAYLKQEPRDSGQDRFRMTSAMMLTHAFDLMFSGLTEATFDDIKELTKSVFGDGTDKHQHRATSEIMGALLCCAPDLKTDLRTQVWEYVFPLVRGIFQDGLTPENSSYWTTFLHIALQGKDPRRSWPLIDGLAAFRLDMSSSQAFKESSKINLLQQCVIDCGWHFQLEKPILEDFMNHLDHPYKAVREAMGQTIASIYRTRYHESYSNVKALVEAQKSSSSIGVRPYQPDDKYTETITEVFNRLEKWRKERPAGEQQPTSYTQASKTVLLWLDSNLSSYECTQLVPFFPSLFMEQLLHMMDVKEDPELQSLAYHVFRHLPNIPHRAGEDEEFINAMIRIGRNATSWHQRLRVLINIQVIYFRRLFLMTEAQQQALFDCVSAMLGDSQLEVRLGAQTTLSGMIRCSPVAFRTRQVEDLRNRFSKMLRENPLPKRRVPGTPTPEQNRLLLVRHAAVLGLGALISAFPYTSPPPAWLPDVLATLAIKAAGDPGTVGKSVKSILADFKKTRQDTWHVDVKAFEPEQLEDLEGVLWKSYFA
ncbi:Armadillo-like helical [Neofusicoccum parvum]|nr:Armadillo-like helical [Neofusicoccum parvum]